MRLNRFSIFTVLSVVIIVASAMVWMGCSTEPTTAPLYQPGDASFSNAILPAQAAEIAQVMAVQNKHTIELEKIDGVFGTATGLDHTGKPTMLVMASRADVRGVPAKIEGVNVRLMVTDQPQLFPKPDRPGGGGNDGGGKVDLKGRADRPVNIGYSIGNYNECASGTLGCVVEKGGNLYILSNNHVLARQNAGSNGEPIGQPGLFDNKPQCSGFWADTIASLSQYVTVQTGTNANNKVDAAIASTNSDMVDCATPSNFYGLPNSTSVNAAVGMAIQKVGRTTALTTGTIQAINATVTIAYAGANTRFVDQFLTTSGFSKSGDSGSLIVTNNADANPVGLLFAGNKQGYTWCNRIQNVTQALNISICGK